MNIHTFELHVDQAKRIHDMLADRIQTHENWICSAVENDEMERAKNLCKERNELKALYAQFNLDVKREISERAGREMPTIHSFRGR